ncbi:hypothetical protein [Flavobacterium caeni]|uniref:Uncharacterized protein n=1 Tax=Flavobacterium caeni TaxID=490189 RepID=A0A1G5JYV2_9FLAO|nr:hypothetical protein [Flavobacterium caeni]SCY93364.1 hypothetical protein SAMN02927903_02971 [Flavobacterium caeni]
MKPIQTLLRFVLFLSLSAIICSCEAEPESYDDYNFVPDLPCNYTQWSGTGSCNSGYYPVYNNTCAPENYPFYNTATTLCYTSCEAAYNANPEGQIFRYNENGGGGGSCNYTQWTGTGSCASGYHPVYTNVCAPVGYPFYNTATTLCYTSCEAAYNANPQGQIFRHNENGGGGGSCDYTQWTGTGSCASGYYPVYTNVCAPVAFPFYNTATNLCYATCSAAFNANPAGQIYRSNENGGGGGGDSQIVFWTATSQYGQIDIYVNGSFRGTITNTYSGAPSCGAGGCVTVTISGTGNTWYATAGNHTWNSSALTLTSACTTMQLY